MDAEESMLRNAQQIQQVNPDVITWVYRNGIKVSALHVQAPGVCLIAHLGRLVVLHALPRPCIDCVT